MTTLLERIDGAVVEDKERGLFRCRRDIFTDVEMYELEMEHITPSRYLLLVTTGDEVLDYRDAVRRYRGCEQVVVEGGDHGFSNIEHYLGRILAYCGIRRESHA